MRAIDAVIFQVRRRGGRCKKPALLTASIIIAFNATYNAIVNASIRDKTATYAKASDRFSP
jgi:hypothetical protein